MNKTKYLKKSKQLHFKNFELVKKVILDKDGFVNDIKYTKLTLTQQKILLLIFNKSLLSESNVISISFSEFNEMCNYSMTKTLKWKKELEWIVKLEYFKTKSNKEKNSLRVFPSSIIFDDFVELSVNQKIIELLVTEKNFIVTNLNNLPNIKSKFYLLLHDELKSICFKDSITGGEWSKLYTLEQLQKFFGTNYKHAMFINRVLEPATTEINELNNNLHLEWVVDKNKNFILKVRHQQFVNDELF